MYDGREATIGKTYGSYVLAVHTGAAPAPAPDITVSDSVVPDITVTDTVTPTGDLQIPFGDITEGNTSDHTVTLTNDGTADLVIGQIAQTDRLAAPFTLINDNCSLQTLNPTSNCTFTIRFSPTSVAVSSDSLDIPSNDADENPVTVNISGSGVSAGSSSSSNNSSDGVFGIGAFGPLTLFAMFMLSAINLVHRHQRSQKAPTRSSPFSRL